MHFPKSGMQHRRARGGAGAAATAAKPLRAAGRSQAYHVAVGVLNDDDDDDVQTGAAAFGGARASAAFLVPPLPAQPALAAAAAAAAAASQALDAVRALEAIVAWQRAELEHACADRVELEQARERERRLEARLAALEARVCACVYCV